MLIVDKETLEVCNAEDLRSEYPHILFDFTDPEIVGEVLADIGMAVLHMPDQPVFDSRYQYAVPSAIVENEGVYTGEWELLPVDMPISDLSAIKAAEITQSCESAITAGFWSDALGSTHFYSCDIPAQLNIQANLLAASIGRDVRHICTDANGNRAIRDHSAAQMIAVGESMGEHIWAQLEKVDGLRIALEAAVADNDVDAVIAIKW